jgi:uncharacterized protein YkwD
MAPGRASSFRPTLEPLEAREVPAAVTIDLRAGVLTVLGTGYTDNVNVARVNAAVRVIGHTVVSGVVHPVVRHFPAAQVNSVVIATEGGNDAIAVGLAVPSRLYGGAGNDTLWGGGGADQLLGGAGADRLFGRGGPDNLVGGAGPDSLDGGAGANTLSQEGQPLPYQMNEVERAVVTLVNLERAALGLAPLAGNALLGGAAKTHANNMAARSNSVGEAAMAHTLLGTITPTPTTRMDRAGYGGWRAWGENVAYGFATAQEVVAGWMGSPGHRANILNPGFTEIGVGATANAYGELYWGQNFGAR